MSNEQKEVVNATPEQVVDAPKEVESKETVNAGKGEIVTPTGKEAPKKVQTKEEDANYAKIRKDAEAKATNDLIKKIAKEQGWNGIEDLKQYNEAVKEQNARKKSEETGIDIEVVKEQERIKEENAKLKKQVERQEQYQKFFKEFPDVDAKTIPKEVWDDFARSNDLVKSYRKFDYKRLQEQLKAILKEKKAEKLNKENAQASTGSVKGKGNSAEVGDFIDEETFEKNRSDKNWIKKNFKKIVTSRGKW